jgi:hypothetical protein
MADHQRLPRVPGPDVIIGEQHLQLVLGEYAHAGGLDYWIWRGRTFPAGIIAE